MEKQTRTMPDAEVWHKKDESGSGKDDLRKWPIVWSPNYAVRFWGLQKLHPFDAAKGERIMKYMVREGVMAEGRFYEPREILKEELLRVHTPKYLKKLQWSINAARIAEIPPLLFVPNAWVQRGYLRPMRFQTAGSMLAGKLALEFGWAINLGGGFHHCCSYRGGGFCAYADITLLIYHLFDEYSKLRTAMIVDLDAHQGNGHERDFINNPNVFIFDMYNASIYPRGDHQAKRAIRCAVKLKPGAGDKDYLPVLRRLLPRCLDDFKPDFVVYNAGTDVLMGDPLGMMSLTPEGVLERDAYVFSSFRRLRIPIVMLLSGGYSKLSARVIADSILNLKHRGLLDV